MGAENEKEESTVLNATLKRMIRRKKRMLIKETKEMLLHEPLGDWAREMKEDKRNRQRWLHMGMRKVKQVAPAAFTKHLNDVHEQWHYPPITPRTFALPSDFEERARRTIVKTGTQRAHQTIYR